MADIKLEDIDVYPKIDILDEQRYLKRQWQLNMRYYGIISCKYKARKMMISELRKKHFQDR
jgi:hypothetical protein